MKKLHISFLSAIFIALVFTIQTNAQITFQVGGGIGYSVPSGDYGGTTLDYYAGTKYGMDPGFNFHGKARVGLLFINAFGEIGYTTFSGSGEAEPGIGTIDISHKWVSVKLGPEFAMSIPMSPITPYLQAFVSLNSLSGTVEFQDNVPNVDNGSYDITSATRIGIGAGAGVTFSLGGLKLDANIQYHVMNIGGKEYRETLTTHTRRDGYTALNDLKDPLYTVNSTGYFIAEDRGISAIEFKLSAMFGL